MSNETKRDVFVNLAEDVKINDSFDEEYPKSREDIEKEYKENIHNYDAALPDDMPVIPKEVGDYIRAKKRKNTSQSVYYLLRDTGVLWRRKKESKILSYMHDDPDTFARAWLLGVWRVEETGEIVKLEEEK